MAYSEQASARFRDALAGMEGISEKRMMGGLCFFLNGNMLGGADQTKQAVPRFMFRVGKENAAEGEGLPGAEPMVQGGRPMPGFFFVDEETCSEEALKAWLSLSLSHAAGLPPK